MAAKKFFLKGLSAAISGALRSSEADLWKSAAFVSRSRSSSPSRGRLDQFELLALPRFILPLTHSNSPRVTSDLLIILSISSAERLRIVRFHLADFRRA